MPRPRCWAYTSTFDIAIFFFFYYGLAYQGHRGRKWTQMEEQKEMSPIISKGNGIKRQHFGCLCREGRVCVFASFDANNKNQCL